MATKARRKGGRPKEARSSRKGKGKPSIPSLLFAQASPRSIGRVELPAEPTREQVDALAAALAERLGVQVQLESTVRPELLAGFIVRLGSRVFDGSLRTRLARFAAEARAR